MRSDSSWESCGFCLLSWLCFLMHCMSQFVDTLQTFESPFLQQLASCLHLQFPQQGRCLYLLRNDRDMSVCSIRCETTSVVHTYHFYACRVCATLQGLAYRSLPTLVHVKQAKRGHHTRMPAKSSLLRVLYDVDLCTSEVVATQQCSGSPQCSAECNVNLAAKTLGKKPGFRP